MLPSEPDMAEALRKLTPERIFVALLAGALIDYPEMPLKSDLRLWSVILPYFNKASGTQQDTSKSNESNMLDKIAQNFDATELRFYGTEIQLSLRSVSTLQTQLSAIHSKVTESKEIKEKSFLGSVCKDVWYCFAILDITGSTQVWRLLVNYSEPFLTKLGIEQKDPEIEKLKSILGKALAPLNMVKPTLLEHQELNGKSGEEVRENGVLDINKLHETIHRSCDLGQSADNGFLVLAEAYAAQGNIGAALQVVNEIFLRDRRSLIRKMRRDDSKSDLSADHEPLKVNSARINRELVGWLQNILCIYDRPTSPTPPPALDVPLNQLRYYYASTASTEAEKVEVCIQQLQSEVAAGVLSPKILETLIGVKSHFGSLFQATLSDLVSQYFLASSQIWHAFGFATLCDTYNHLAKGKLENERRPAISSELALLDAFDRQNPIEGLVDLVKVKQPDWNDICQNTYALIMAQSLILAHDYEGAKVVIEQIEDTCLPRRQKEAYHLVQIMLHLYESKYYTAFLLAQRRAQLHGTAGATYLELTYTVWAVRCLTLSQSEVCAGQAHILISDAVPCAMESQKLGIVFELAVLEARLLYNKGEMAGCHSICKHIEPLVEVSSTRKLRCEWKVLYLSASQSLGKTPPVELIQSELAECLYTEFNQDLVTTVSTLMGVRILYHVSDRNTLANNLSHSIQSTFSNILNKDDADVEQVYGAYANTVFTTEGDSVIPKLSPNAAASPPMGSNSALSDDDSMSKLQPQKRSWSVNGSPQRRNSKRRSVSFKLR